jgi:hypothetical protein
MATPLEERHPEIAKVARITRPDQNQLPHPRCRGKGKAVPPARPPRRSGSPTSTVKTPMEAYALTAPVFHEVLRTDKGLADRIKVHLMGRQ